MRVQGVPPCAEATGKNVVVCCDGTANEFATDHTNVLKLFRVLDSDPRRQVAFYHPGLGTMEATAALTSVSRQATKLLGLAIGLGLERDVTNAYDPMTSAITDSLGWEIQVGDY